MSIDTKLGISCDHRIYMEQVFIEEDKKTIRIPRLTSSSEVDLYINGYKVEKNDKSLGWTLQTDTVIREFDDTSIDLYNNYITILNNKFVLNDKVLFNTNGEAPVGLSKGVYYYIIPYGTDEIQLKKNINDISPITILTTGSGIFTLTLYKEDSNLKYQKMIVLNNKTKSNSDFFLISYTVYPIFCPKCKGFKVIDDIVYTGSGNLNTTSEGYKLLQEIKKGLNTLLGTNPFHTWYGTQLQAMIGTKVTDVNLTRSKISEEIQKFLEKYVDIQTQQSKYQTVTESESFLRIDTLEIEPDSSDPSIWNIAIIIVTQSFEKLIYETQINLKAPSI